MRYAIGDIHGGAKTFRALLQKINLKRVDQVYLLGDYVDRGPDCKGVFDTIIQLTAGGYDIKPVRGNHDDMLLRNATGDHDKFSEYWMSGWGEEALKSFGVEQASDLPSCYLELIESMPYVRYDNQFVFVHAGLNMMAIDPIRESSPEAMMWGDTAVVDVARLGGRKLVTGHTIRPIPLIEISLASNHILLDNGAFTGEQPDLGNLVALNLDTMTLTLQPWIDELPFQTAAVCETKFQLGQSTEPLIKDTTIMNLIADETRALRLARVMMDDIGQYFPELVKQGIQEDNIFELLNDNIEESRMEFEKRISPDLDRTKIFNSALVNVLIKRAYKYKTHEEKS